MTAAIQNSLKGLKDSVELLDITIAEKTKTKNSGQPDLFGSLRAVPSNANAANVEQINSSAFAARLDQAIGRVEEMLKTGRV